MSELLPAWDLKDLFSGLNDKKIKRTNEKNAKDIQSFVRRHRGKIKKHNTQKIVSAIKEYEAIYVSLSKPLEYASLRFSECASDPEAQAFLQSTQSEYVKLSSELVFFVLELSNLPKKRLKKLALASHRHSYRRFFEKLIIQKKHQLHEIEEKLLRESSLTGRSAFTRLFDQEFAYKKFTLKTLSKKIEVSETELLSLMSNQDRNKRKAALMSLISGLKEDSWRLTFIFNNLIEDKRLDDERRKYSLPEESRHLANEISVDSVKVLSDCVFEKYSIVQGYTRFKHKLLGLARFELYDRYAPIRGAEKSYNFEEAKNLVLKSFSRFSAQYVGLAKEFFDKRWIDAAKRAGKRGGAYCTYGTPDLHPYVFMNFSGTLRDVFTLAHELGHAIHGSLMRKQTFLNFDAPLTMAEMASTFAELLLFDHMKKKMKSKRALLGLYVFYIDNLIATVFRQISMHRFEQVLHDRKREEGELKPETISEIWQEQQKQLYGNSLRFPEGSEYLWSYIPHFVHSPFYVYAYSFGNLLALSLFSNYRKEGKSFIPKFLRLLSLGCSQSPDELVKPFDIDLDSAKTWNNALGLIESFVEEAKELS
jgi:oligoendopeptidase F